MGDVWVYGIIILFIIAIIHGLLFETPWLHFLFSSDESFERIRDKYEDKLINILIIGVLILGVIELLYVPSVPAPIQN